MLISPRLILSVFLILSFRAGVKGQESGIAEIRIPYCREPKVIDGKTKDWPSDPDHIIYFAFPGHRDPNHCRLQWSWDEQFLYLCARIRDRQLTGLEKQAASHRIHYNDSFEFYIDSHNDSQDTIDVNDYQFIVEISGGNAVFRGDRHNLQLKHIVPKEPGIANIVFQSQTTWEGTLNNTSDIDSGWVAELAIPWAGIGIHPLTGVRFKADFCMNDNDTLVDFHDLPEGPVMQYVNVNIRGHNDFGYPANWVTAQLTGGPSWQSGTQVNILASRVFWLLASGGLLLVLLLLHLYKRRLFYRQPLPGSPVLISARLQSIPSVSDSQEKKYPCPVIEKARHLIEVQPEGIISVEELASLLAMSSRKLQRIFKNEMNTSPKNFILGVKLQKAAILLRSTSLSVNEIAYSAGFTDPSYFNKVFRRFYQVSPRDYRNRKEIIAEDMEVVNDPDSN